MVDTAAPQNQNNFHEIMVVQRHIAVQNCMDCLDWRMARHKKVAAEQSDG
jgi:hypothetical protein